MVQCLNYERTFFNNFALHSCIFCQKPLCTMIEMYYDRNIYLSPVANYHSLLIQIASFLLSHKNRLVPVLFCTICDRMFASG